MEARPVSYAVWWLPEDKESHECKTAKTLAEARRIARMAANEHFQVGDRIEYLGDVVVHIPCAECLAKSYYHDNGRRGDCEHRPLKGQIGVVERVNNGHGCFPPRWLPPENEEGDGCWAGEHAGWLTVRFSFDVYGREADGCYKPRACLLNDEGVDWRRVASVAALKLAEKGAARAIAKLKKGAKGQTPWPSR